MPRTMNFNAGPAALPLPALERAREELLDFAKSGMSVMEHSHRGKEYEAVHNEAIALTRELRAKTRAEELSRRVASLAAQVGRTASGVDARVAHVEVALSNPSPSVARMLANAARPQRPRAIPIAKRRAAPASFASCARHAGVAAAQHAAIAFGSPVRHRMPAAMHRPT